MRPSSTIAEIASCQTTPATKVQQILALGLTPRNGRKTLSLNQAIKQANEVDENRPSHVAFHDQDDSNMRTVELATGEAHAAALVAQRGSGYGWDPRKEKNQVRFIAYAETKPVGTRGAEAKRVRYGR